ncbi:MAG: hypothetical protein ACI9I0_000517 [Rhodoferax sp.]|jgi:hypothetical protein
MPSCFLITPVLIATYVVSTGASAQAIYKCGDSYSQLPCPGGLRIEAADPRTAVQKLQADSIIQRDARQADRMKKSRLQQEQKDLMANTPTVLRKLPAKKNTKAPDYFSAQMPDEKKN